MYEIMGANTALWIPTDLDESIEKYRNERNTKLISDFKKPLRYSGACIELIRIGLLAVKNGHGGE